MKDLTVYAHPDPHSFCHDVLQRFTAGLEDAGHLSQVVDLYAMDFDPVLRERDQPNWINDTMPEDIAALHDIRGNVVRSCRNPLQRWLVKRAVRGKSHAEVAGMTSAAPERIGEYLDHAYRLGRDFDRSPVTTT